MCVRLSIPSTDLPIQAGTLMVDNKRLPKSRPWDSSFTMPITTLLSWCTRGPPKWGIRGNTRNPRDKYLLEAATVACRPFHSSPLHAQRLVLTIPSHISSGQQKDGALANRAGTPHGVLLHRLLSGFDSALLALGRQASTRTR